MAFKTPWLRKTAAVTIHDLRMINARGKRVHRVDAPLQLNVESQLEVAGMREPA